MEPFKQSFCSLPICLVYHICAIDQYRAILIDMIEQLKASGAWDCFDKIYYAVAGGTETDLDDIQNIFQNKGILIAFHADISIYERLTLHALYDIVKLSPTDFYILYLHTKGVKSDPNLKNIKKWRDYMLYYLNNYMPLCLSILENSENLKAIGVNRRSDPSLHYSGNFWWTSSKHIRQLSVPIGSEYIDPEMWLGLHSNSEEFMSLYQFFVYWYSPNEYELLPYYNNLFNKDIPLPIKSLRLFTDIAEISYYGRDHNWKIINRSLLEKKIKDANGSIRVSLSNIFFSSTDDNIFDPYPNVSKIWTFQHPTTNKRITFLENMEITIKL